MDPTGAAGHEHIRPATDAERADVRAMHAANRSAWDEAAERYEGWLPEAIELIRSGGTNLLAPELELIGDLHGRCRRAIHLQCAGGRDSLSLWNLGADEIVGVDFSPRMIALAERLTAAVGAPARWIVSDVLDTPHELDGTADLLYTGRGALIWLQDLDAWAAVLRRLLAPDGRLVLFDGHPAEWLFDVDEDGGWIATDYDYFARTGGLEGLVARVHRPPLDRRRTPELEVRPGVDARRGRSPPSSGRACAWRRWPSIRPTGGAATPTSVTTSAAGCRCRSPCWPAAVSAADRAPTRGVASGHGAPMTEERRLVTILFADVRGSTALGESLDPEDLRALLSRYYGIAREVVADYGGTIEKFIGDAVMAVFGLPVAHGDDAERALGAAMDLRDRVRDDPRLGERLPIRLGVASGEVVARRDAAEDQDFLITGDAVNVAARLQQGGDAWSITVADRTATSAGGFRFGPAVGVDAKGKAVAIAARSLLGRAARARRRLPMIGRDADLMQLELVARRAFTERRPFLVSIVAPAGTGKTRLLEALVDRLPDLAGNATVALAQCLPYGQRLTYWPLRAVLHRLTGTTDDTAPDALRSITEAWLRDRGVLDATAVAGQLLATVGAADLEVVDRTLLFGAWRTALEAAASDGPIALVLEDLHWSSDSLLDLIDSIVQPRGELPILIVALARPELLERRPTWSGGRRNALSLALDPLSAPDVATLVEHLVEGASPHVIEAVVERADGNPFYAGEIARTLVEQVGPSLDPAAVREALFRLPDTVQATVLARLDLLDPADRRMLQVGAVFGRSFLPRGVAAVEPSLEATIDEITERLLDRDLVRPASQGELAFRHILIREVAYGMLPRAERARLHAAAATWLSARATGQEDAYAELIAVHAREAATLATALGLDDAGAMRAAAVDRLVAAAESALAAGANVESLRHLRAALEFATPDRHLDLYERMGDTIVHGDTNIEYLRAALDLARSSDAPPERILRILGGILLFHTRWQGSVAGRPSEAELMKLFEEGRALLTPTTDESVRARFLVVETFLPFWISAEGRTPSVAEFDRGLASGRAALDVGQRLGDAVLMSTALDGIGSIAQLRGDYGELHATSIQRLALGERLPIAERIDAACMVAWCGMATGDLAGAEAVAGAAFAMLQPGQAENWSLHLSSWRTLIAAASGDWDVALASANRAHALWVELDRVPAGYSMRGFVAALDIARARHDIEGATRWREVVEDINSHFRTSTRRRLQAAHTAGDTSAIVTALQTSEYGALSDDVLERALGFALDRDVRLDDALLARLEKAAFPGARLVIAQINRAKGLAHRDAAPLRAALATFEQSGARPSAARVRCELGRLTDDGALVETGLRELREIGDLDQLDRYT